MKELYGVVERNEKSFWTRIGTAFENKDGSLNLKFDFLPTNPESTIQLREKKEKPAEEVSEPKKSRR